MNDGAFYFWYMRTEELYEHYLRSTGVTTDTRQATDGKIFFALKGERFNGNQYAQQALDAGCALAVIDEAEFANAEQTFLVEDVLTALQELAKYHRQQFKGKIIGLTGSNGKTTSKELIREVLASTYPTYATKGNLNNHIGVPLSLLEMTDNHEFAVIEMGANAQKEIQFLSTLSDPDFGYITNIGKAHLEGFGGLEGVRKGKKELFDHLKEKNRPVFINCTDPTLLAISEGMERILYGTSVDTPEVYLLDTDPLLSIAWTHDAYTSPKVQTQLTGEYNLNNIAAAIAMGIYFGVKPEAINHAIAEYKPDNNRSERKQGKHNTLIMDAYNANPTSMFNALESFAKGQDENKLCILGDMFELGDVADEEHRKVVALTEKLNLEAIFVGSHFAKVGNGDAFIETTDELIERLKANLPQQRSILVKGSRGMRLERAAELL